MPEPDQLARGLGWFSLGLGLAELAAPRTVAHLVGVPGPENEGRLRMMGMREIASGVGILMNPQQPAWLWARVGGDVMDLAFLGGAHRGRTANRTHLTTAIAAVAGVTLLDALVGQRLRSEAPDAGTRGRVHVNRVVTIDRTPLEIYSFWRNFENLPRFMEHLESVRVTGDRHSRWKASAPAGSVEWDAEIVDDRPGELIGWRSLPTADVPNSGVVRFTSAPGGQGTEVHVELDYEPPAGRLGSFVAKLFGEEPGQQVGSDLRRLKQVLETGEVIRSDASIHRGMHPARPSSGEEVSQ